MILPWALLALLLSPTLAKVPTKRHYNTHDYYVLEHDPSTASLDDATKALGVELVDRAGELQNHWLVRVEKPTQGLGAREELGDSVLARYEALQARSYTKRASTRSHPARNIVSSVKLLERQTLRKRVKRAPPPIHDEPSKSDSNLTSHAVALRLGITDPFFPRQWHLVNDDYQENMMNATPLWEMGITGKGVISTLVDDGLDYRSEDLADNFDAADSYDFNDHVDLPTPVLFDDHHGTRCAGQIAAVRNDHCGVGIAYDSKVAGVRILSGPISDVDEAAALNYGYQNVSIYSCSWGPPDDGKSMEGPSTLIKKAVLNGVTNGRGGRGSIYVFASGNGAGFGDQCNFDGYTNSIYSVTVAAVDYMNLHPYYSESCAANMVVAYSSGSRKHIVTTDKGKDECATNHGGTSAAAPNAVGVFALALEVRPDLTWRDIQHLCVKTARVINSEDPDWETMASGRLYSYKYGFGVLDAYAYVTAAKDWELVKPQTWFTIDPIQINNGSMNILNEFSGGEFIVPGGIKSTATVTPAMLKKNNFDSLEHVNVKVWISHGKRGDVEVQLVSPNGIKSVLAAPRKSDADTFGYPGWTFMSVKHWGENPVGDWTIRVSDQSNANNGSFLGWSMMFWGSAVDPARAQAYELPVDDTLLPPPHPDDPPATNTVPVSTKVRPKPTVPAGHDDGENHKPAFPGQDDTVEPSGSPVSTPTPDEGWFPNMSNLVSESKWLFGAVGAVVLFSIGAGVFFWRRRLLSRRRANYTSLPGGDSLPMSSIRDGRSNSGGARTKELYDAFGEVSDDEDADEETGLRGGRPQDRSPGGLGFHSGFLDDEEVHTAQADGPIPIYRDEPDDGLQGDSGRREEGSSSPSVSGDGSWEHASQTR